jgi:hypothetical protein
MSSFPSSPRAAFLAWCKHHEPIFTDNTTAIGISVTQAAAFATATTAAQNSVDAVEAARSAFRAAVQTANIAVRTLRGQAGDAVRSVRSFAELQPDPQAIYALAQIPPQAPPSPAPPPGTPYQLEVSLLQTGALKLRWKCQNPSGTSGTVYEVFRRNQPGAPFQYIGALGGRSFTDETLPSGSASVTYQITAVRSTVRGNPAQFTINFGIGGGGAFNFIASVVEETQGGGGAKLAA